MKTTDIRIWMTRLSSSGCLRRAQRAMGRAGYDPYETFDALALHYRRVWAKYQSDIVRRQRIK